ncbi:GIY-YIG nuclease family protein [Silvibacterium sp.]|uniref:GIY-YIG nuclease family protein n=1 Tax=Silvibacterium sp. TaxID=1964179 RepID=UPI0039E2A9E6
MTGNLEKRIYQHQHGIFDGFTSEYHCHRLVWFEMFEDVHSAIDREKQIKRWRREKKLALIQRMNPTWSDLSQSWKR